MSTTPILDILELVASQTQPHIPVNEAIRTLEVFGQLAVIAIENTPPAVVDGNSYIVGDAPTGDWAGYARWIAYGVGGGWRYALPRNGWLAYNQDDELYYRYVGLGSPTSWEPLTGIPQNPQAGNYGIVAADNGRSIDHLSGAGAGDTYTIPANGTLALPIGFTFSVCNLDSNAVSIAIITDTLYLLPSGATGTRTVAQYGLATFRKVAATTWVCCGVNLT
jgi:Protein of unknown function (DUF2793)